MVLYVVEDTIRKDGIQREYCLHDNGTLTNETDKILVGHHFNEEKAVELFTYYLGYTIIEIVR